MGVARLYKVEGAGLNGGLEERRSGRDQSGNKPACFERCDTDRFKAQYPIWLARTKGCTSTQPSSTKHGEKDRNAEILKKVMVNQLGILS